MAEQMGGTAGQIASPQPYDRAPYQLSADVDRYFQMKDQALAIEAHNNRPILSGLRNSWLGQLLGARPLPPAPTFGPFE